ncbi:hypothetical protein [Catenuloplanes japonicus]|uniref:hypothetical protein n=1 Tax=Catenuloplanes japonicus TaxID=33876 RepID=UPI0005249BBE|nr:hypothetical protein [Catenuloplanes japonicus]
MNLEQFSWAGGLVGAFTGIAALITSVYFTRRATKAAEDAAASARRTAKVEVDRHHGELTPQVTVEAAAAGHGSDRVTVTLCLDGPPGLRHLDEMLIRIRGDQPQRVLAGDPSEEELRAVIWAPYRLVPGVDGADLDGRSVNVATVRSGDRRTLVLEPSPAPAWITADEWAARHDETPIRLAIECTRTGDEPWPLLREFPQPQAEFEPHLTTKSGGILVLRCTNTGNAPAKGPVFTDDTGDDVSVEGTYRELVHPSESTQSAWIYRTAAGHTEWVRLAWTDLRGVTRSMRYRLPD